MIPHPLSLPDLLPERTKSSHPTCRPHTLDTPNSAAPPPHLPTPHPRLPGLRRSPTPPLLPTPPRRRSATTVDFGGAEPAGGHLRADGGWSRSSPRPWVGCAAGAQDAPPLSPLRRSSPLHRLSPLRRHGDQPPRRISAVPNRAVGTCGPVGAGRAHAAEPHIARAPRPLVGCSAAPEQWPYLRPRALSGRRASGGLGPRGVPRGVRGAAGATRGGPRGVRGGPTCGPGSAGGVPP